MADIKADKSLKERLINQFHEFESKLNGGKGTDIFKVRKNAIDYFNEIGFPNVKNEYWKYTNLTFMNRMDFELGSGEESELPDSLIDEATYDSKDSDLAVIINGVFSEKYSHIEKHDKVIIKSFKKAFEENADDVRNNYGKVIDLESNPFAAINTAFANDGVFIKVSHGHVQEKPLHILFVNDTRQSSIISNPRKLVIAEESSQFSIIESTVTIGENPGMLNLASEIVVGRNANVNYYKIQDEKDNSYAISTSKATVARDARFDKATITLGGKFIRNNLNTEFTGENAESNFYGLFIVNDNNLVDNHTFVDHALPNCQSNEDYKGILDDKATGVFNGKILVRKDAQNTNAYQSNKNILLTDLATINTKPELEIYADDVQCSHGATSGSLDFDMLFYLRSRGVDEKTARGMLLNSFASEITSQIKYDKVRELIESKIASKLEIR